MNSFVASLQRIYALIVKELLVTFRDPRTTFSLFIMPVVQMLIYGYAATYDVNHVPYAVLDEDRSPASRELLARFDGSGYFTRVVNAQNPAQIANAINRQRAIIAVVIAPDFDQNLQSGQPADVQVIADGRNSSTAGTATGYVNAIVTQFSADFLAAHGTGTPAVNVDVRAWYNPNLETRWNMVPSLIGTLTMLQTLFLIAMSVAREREQGTFDQLLVTPLRPAEIMVGKTVPAMLIGTTQATLILFIAQFWFGITFAGSLAVLYTGLVLFLLAAVGIGLLVSAFAATMQQAMLYAFTLILPFILLSGLTTPLENMPVAVQYFTLINPLRYANDIALRVYLEGAGFADLQNDFIPLLVIGAVTLSIAVWVFGRRLE